MSKTQNDPAPKTDEDKLVKRINELNINYNKKIEEYAEAEGECQESNEEFMKFLIRGYTKGEKDDSYDELYKNYVDKKISMYQKQNQAMKLLQALYNANNSYLTGAVTYLQSQLNELKSGGSKSDNTSQTESDQAGPSRLISSGRS